MDEVGIGLKAVVIRGNQNAGFFFQHPVAPLRRYPFGDLGKGQIHDSDADDKNGKFNVYLMDRVRALAGAESQNIEIIFVSNDGETASILGNAFAEDLGFKNVYVLKGGIKAWIDEEKALVSFLK